AARRVEPEGVAGLQRIVRIAGRQAPRLVGVGIDPDVAGAPVRAAGEPVGCDHVLGRADGEAGLREIEIFAPDAQAAAELARTAGIADQLEAQHPGREFALDDLDRRDLGVGLVDGRARGAVAARAGAGAAAHDLILHIALARIGAASAD